MCNKAFQKNLIERMDMKENSIFISDDNGKEIEMKILLTFDANDKKYVVVYEEDNPDNLYGFVYDDEGNMYQVDSQEEIEMIQEVVNAYEEKSEE